MINKIFKRFLTIALIAVLTTIMVLSFRIGSYFTVYAVEAEELETVCTGYSIPVKNIVDGNPEKDTAFEFVLSHEGACKGYIMPDECSVTIMGEDMNEFEEIYFTQAGKYEFIVCETGEHAENYIYDYSRYVVTITVEKRGHALAVTDVSYMRNGEVSEQVAMFRNSYATGDPTMPKAGETIYMIIYGVLMLICIIVLIVLLIV